MSRSRVCPRFVLIRCIPYILRTWFYASLVNWTWVLPWEKRFNCFSLREGSAVRDVASHGAGHLHLGWWPQVTSVKLRTAKVCKDQRTSIENHDYSWQVESFISDATVNLTPWLATWRCKPRFTLPNRYTGQWRNNRMHGKHGVQDQNANESKPSGSSIAFSFRIFSDKRFLKVSLD